MLDMKLRIAAAQAEPETTYSLYSTTGFVISDLFFVHDLFHCFFDCSSVDLWCGTISILDELRTNELLQARTEMKDNILLRMFAFGHE